MFKSVCVYCGSSDKVPSVYQTAAFQLGETLALQGVQMVYGGGGTGLMGAIADGILHHGGDVVGVIPEIFNLPHLVHQNLTHLEVASDMHQRKARMAELADAFIALPGGFGTLEELFEILTWAQVGIHQKPVGLFNTQGFFDPLLAMITHIESLGFIYSEHKMLLLNSPHPLELLEQLGTYQKPSELDRWVNRDAVVD